jgi:hypothetical protein
MSELKRRKRIVGHFDDVTEATRAASEATDLGATTSIEQRSPSADARAVKPRRTGINGAIGAVAGLGVGLVVAMIAAVWLENDRPEFAIIALAFFTFAGWWVGRLVRGLESGGHHSAIVRGDIEGHRAADLRGVFERYGANGISEEAAARD